MNRKNPLPRFSTRSAPSAPSQPGWASRPQRVRSGRQFARVSSENGITFARGQRIEIELDEERFTGGGAFLFASVLERFLALNATLNSFTQLVVTTPQRKEALREWQPRAGRKLLI